MTTKKRTDLYQEITDRIIKSVEKALGEGGQTKWTAPWDAMAANMPRNAVTGRRYNGINSLMLGMDERNFSDPRWCTYRQAQTQGWQVRKGEKSTTVYLFKPFTKEEKKDDGTVAERSGMMLRTFRVFHASQMDGIPEWEPPSLPTRNTWEEHAAAERVIKEANPILIYGGDRAFYSPATDTITLPIREAFRSADGFYATALHELAHWTGGKEDRVPRREGVSGGPFGSQSYAREEIRADIASAIMRGVLGVNDSDEAGCADTVAYVRSWLRALQDDKYEARRAVADAQKIADFLLGDEAKETSDAN